MFHSLVLLGDGSVYGFGNDDLGQLGLGRGTGVHPYDTIYLSRSSATNVTSPTRIEALKGHRIVAMAAGEMHSLFVDQQGRLLSCGMDKKSCVFQSISWHPIADRPWLL